MSAEALKAKHHAPQEGQPVALRASGDSFSTRLRFGLAGLLRWTERFADKMVGGYDKLFGLGQEDKADIYFQLGSDFTRDGRVDEAVTALTRTLTLQPENAEAWFQLGVAYMRQDALPAAIDAFTRAAKLGLSSFDLHFNWATALCDLDRHEEAVVEYQRALEQRPESRLAAETAYRLGVALDQLKRYEEAVTAFRVAIEQDPKVVSYYQSMGFTLESMGRRDEAIQCFKMAVTIERRNNA